MIVALSQVITDVQMTDAVAEFFDKFKNTPSVWGADVSMPGVQCKFKIRKALHDFNKIIRLNKSPASGKHILQTYT